MSDTTVNAPMLADVAAEALDRAREASIAAAEADLRQSRERVQRTLREAIEAAFPMLEAERVRIEGDPEQGGYVGMVDALRFQVRSDSGWGEPTLHVERTCAHCGESVWISLGAYANQQLLRLGEVLDQDEHTHEAAAGWDCRQRYDEDGEPITDRDGNPLLARPPKQPVRSAGDEIDDIEACARVRNVARRTEKAAIAARDRLLLDIVGRLLKETNPLTGKPHSYTSAEAAAKLTDEYQAAEVLRLDAEDERELAEARYEMQKLRAVAAVETMAAVETVL